MEERTFAASYSSGKDSTLAVYKTIQCGLKLKELIMTYNTDKDISWFHGVPEPIIDRLSRSIGAPIRLIRTSGGSEYERNFEAALKEVRAGGTEICVFGDIDIEEHRVWCSDRCTQSGMEACFPLWRKSREDVVSEFIAREFTTYITVVDTERMSEAYLGEKLTAAVMRSLKKDGVDVCGENGEYHTFVTDGPLFSEPVEFRFGNVLHQGKYAVLPVEP